MHPLFPGYLHHNIGNEQTRSPGEMGTCTWWCTDKLTEYKKIEIKGRPERSDQQRPDAKKARCIYTNILCTLFSIKHYVLWNSNRLLRSTCPKTGILVRPVHPRVSEQRHVRILFESRTAASATTGETGQTQQCRLGICLFSESEIACPCSFRFWFVRAFACQECLAICRDCL